MLLGQQPNWTDPERIQSIDTQRGFAMMNARLGEWEFHHRKCWAALPPAQSCLKETWTRIESLFRIDTNQIDLTSGETTNPGYSFDRFMHGREIYDAQPAIIFDSKSKIYRANAKRILNNAAIEVDIRGIGLQLYERGPVLSASQETGDPLAKISGIAEGSLKGVSQDSFGASIKIGSTTCTMGGVISINGKLFGLTVGHGFNDIDLGKGSIKESNRTIGSLAFKSRTYDKRDLDWAVCTIDKWEIPLTNQITLPNDSIPVQLTMANKDPDGATVLLRYGAETISGFITADYSLVALPGQAFAQRMWIVILDRETSAGDCGTWVVDSKNGEVYGYIVARKPDTRMAYIVLMRDVLKDIAHQFQQLDVKIPTKEDLAESPVGTLEAALQLAIECNRLDAIESLLEEGANASSLGVGNDGSPLSRAAASGHEAVVKLLLEKGANVDTRDLWGDMRTPLSWAAGSGHEAVVKLLLEKGANVDRLDWGGDKRTPLLWAARSGHEAIVKLLLEKGANMDRPDWGGDWRTPLSWAARSGNEAVVKLLLEKGANVDMPDRGGDWRTPLSWAAGSGNEAVVKLLLEKGADVDRPDRGGDWRTPLSWAAGSGNEAVVKLLLEKGANVDRPDWGGDWRTPLSWAAGSGNEAVVKLLLEKGADVDRPDQGGDGRTPLSWAARSGHEAIVKLLLEKGADVDRPDRGGDGRTPLSWAARSGHEAIVKLLLEKGANVDRPDWGGDGRTPLSWAAGSGHEAVVKLLLAEHGVNPNSKDKLGRIPLLWAVGEGHDSVVKLLKPHKSLPLD